jgi:mannose-6-phosphate isomerase-like protein (cupin superfamily)
VATSVISKRTVPTQKWRVVCDGWTLFDDPHLHVIQERMPPNTHELRHIHDQVRQLYFVLEGEATVEVDDRTEVVPQGEALAITAGAAHRMMNNSDRDLEFLVVSSSPPRADRRDLE